MRALRESEIRRTLRDRFNQTADALVRTEVRWCGRRLPVFQVCGSLGLAVAVPLAMSLCSRRGLPLWVMAAVSLVAVTSFFGLALLVKVVTGEESLTYYHHQVAALASAAGLLTLLGRPLLPYLDATALGIGAFLAFGRLGCCLVGCCHGRPSRWGFCYRQEHAAAGFPSCYVGVRLLPVQLLESLWVMLVVLAGAILVLRGSPPGTALAWYVTVYACGRFVLEFLRGDSGRPYLWGFSEAQWTSLVMVAGIRVGGLAGLLPFHLWRAAATAGLAALLVWAAPSWGRAGTTRARLLHPRHVREVAQILRWLAPRASQPAPPTVEVPVESTSLGIQISAGRYAGQITHYALSRQQGRLSEDDARILAGLICRAKHPLDAYELVAQSPGVFHLLVRPPGEVPSRPGIRPPGGGPRTPWRRA